MMFKVKKGKKAALSFKRIVATPGGKVAVAVTVFLAACSLVLPSIVFDYFSETATAGTAEDVPDVMAFMAGASFAVLAFIFACATFRQRNAGVAMRKEEELVVDGFQIRYSFKPSGDWRANGRNMIVIDLQESHVSFDPKSCEYLFLGGVRGHRYEDISSEMILSPAEFEEMRIFEIGSYFGSEFDDLLLPYLAK